MLARLYATNYGLELFDEDTPPCEAAVFAEKGVSLDPANQRSRVIMSYVRLLMDDLSFGLAEAERAISLNPRSLIMMGEPGYLLTLLGDWKRGSALIRKAMAHLARNFAAVQAGAKEPPVKPCQISRSGLKWR
jgi:hypothetical protein